MEKTGTKKHTRQTRRIHGNASTHASNNNVILHIINLCIFIENIWSKKEEKRTPCRLEEFS